MNPRRILNSVQSQRQVIDYALKRRSVLAQVHAGKTALKDVCDAHPYLLSAAQFHGKTTTITCPICHRDSLILVSWVFGEQLGAISGSARSAQELDALARQYPEFMVYVVEVCPRCSWNHLVKSYVLGLPPQQRKRRSPRTKTCSRKTPILEAELP